MTESTHVQDAEEGRTKSQLISELKQLRREVEVRREEKADHRYRDLVEDSIQGYFIHENFRPLMANRAMAEMFGYDSVEELLALDSALLLVAPEYRAQGEQANAGRRAGKVVPKRTEYKGIRKDGSTIWFDALARLFEWEGRMTVQMVMVDITERRQANLDLEERVADRTRDLEKEIAERKRAEEALRESQHSLKQFLNLAPTNMVYHDRDLRFRQVNARYLELLGKTEEEVIGRTFSEVFGEERFAIYRPSFEKALQGEEAHFEMPSISLKDSKTHYWEIRHIPHFDSQGQVLGIYATVEDITERKQVERLLQENETRLQNFIDFAPSNLGYIDKDLYYRQVNAGYLKFMGMTEEEIVDRPAAEVIGEEALAFYQPWIDKVLAGAEQHFEVSRPHGGLGIRDLDNRQIPNFDAEGRVLGFYISTEDITERKNAERSLRENETRLQNFIDSSPSNLAYVDREYRYRQVNARFLAYLGKSEDEVIGHTVTEVLGESVYEMYRPWLEESFQGREQHFEVVRSFGDQGMRDVEVRLIPNIDSQGQVVGLHAALQDITERKRAERELRESRDNIRLITDNLPVLITRMDRDNRYTFLNKTAEQWYALPAENVLNRSPAEVFPSSSQEKISLLHDTVLSGEVVNTEERILYPDGIERDVQRSYVPDYDEDGNVRGYFGLVLDITKRKRAEKALRESEARFKSIFENSPTLIHLKDLEGHFLLANDRYEEWFGIPALKIIGKTVHEVQSKDFADRITAQEQEVLRSEATVHEELTVGGDAPLTLLNIKFPVRDSEGRVVGVGTIATDVTTQQALESQLRESQKMEAVGILAGGISHEFNNLLQIINGYTQMISERLDRPEKLPAYVERILDAGERAATLTHQLLTFSRKAELNKKQVDLNELVSHHLTMVGGIIEEDIDLDFKPGDHLHPVLVDQSMVEQVILNLCINARDIMPDGGLLGITTNNIEVDQALCASRGWQREGSYVMVNVSDTGMGMSPQILEHIFEPFFTTKEVGKGTGLGLSIAQSIMKQHNGMIDVESIEGQGTTFSLYFPASSGQAGDSDAVSADDNAVNKPVGSETILVAEDQQGVRDLLVEMLKNQGYRVLAAPDGPSAVKQFESERDAVDLVILDVRMPGLKGPQVYEAIRGIRPDVPIVFCTGYSEDEIDTGILKESDLHLIKKPYKQTELFSLLRNLLD